MRLIKSLSLLTLMVLCTTGSFSKSFSCLWGGAGLAASNNYDFGMSYGFYYYKALSYRVGLGIQAFDQKFNLYRSSDLNTFVGGTVSLKADYNFFSPTLVFQLSRTGGFQGYVNAGVGMLGNGTTTIHSWSHVPWPQGVAYDSLLKDRTSDFSSMIYRIGIGFIQYTTIKGHIQFFFNEDMGVLPLSMEKTTNNVEYRNFSGTMNQFFSPVYFSFRFGLAYIHQKRR